MNYLAHFHLAWPEEGLLAGALEGDYRKGPLGPTEPGSLQAGVQLHRKIDAFTDSHPLLTSARELLPKDLRRYAGILLDLSFDHFLCRHWQQFSAVPSDQFNRTVYAVLTRWEARLSAGAQHMLRRLIDHDILGLYGEWDTVPASAERIGQRFKRGNPFINIDRGLNAARTELEQTFLAFYPQLIRFSHQECKSLRNQTIALAQ